MCQMDVEPAVEALCLVHDSDASRPLDLIYLDVQQVQEDDQVESKKRKVKRLRRKHQTSGSSPLTPDCQTVGSLSLSEDLPHSRTRSVAESSDGSKLPESPPETVHQQETVEEPVTASPSTFFSEFFWPQVSLEGQQQRDDHSVPNNQTSDHNEGNKDFDCDFMRPVR